MDAAGESEIREEIAELISSLIDSVGPAVMMESSEFQTSTPLVSAVSMSAESEAVEVVEAGFNTDNEAAVQSVQAEFVSETDIALVIQSTSTEPLLAIPSADSASVDQEISEDRTVPASHAVTVDNSTAALSQTEISDVSIVASESAVNDESSLSAVSTNVSETHNSTQQIVLPELQSAAERKPSITIDLLFRGHAAADQLTCAVTLSKMVFNLEKYGKTFALDASKCLGMWKAHSLQVAGVELKKLDQRVQKLKGLLARTHQAKQRNQEDVVVSQQRAKDLLSSKAKDEKERHSLMEAMRAQEAETEWQRAFHYDMEILIQRAASELVTQPPTPALPRYNRTQFEDLEQELLQTRADLRDMELSNERLALLLEEKEVSVVEHMHAAAAVEQKLSLALKDMEVLKEKLKVETDFRSDVERELKMLIASQSDLSNGIEKKMKQRYDLRKVEVSEELEFTKTQLEKALFDLRTFELRQSELRHELEASVARVQEAERVLAENAQLKQVLEQIKDTSFKQLSDAEQRHEKTIEITTDLVHVGLSAAKSTLALEAQVADMAAAEQQAAKASAIRMVEAFVELTTRCIGPFLLSDAQGESFIRLTPKELLLVDCMRTRLNNIMEERAEAEERMLKEASSTLPSTMQWSAKIHTILPGKEIRIPIPSLPEDATLEWEITCKRDSDYIELLMDKLNPGMVPAGAEVELLSLLSDEHGGRNGMLKYTGSKEVVPNTGDGLLRIRSKAVLASITIGYLVKLVTERNRDLSAKRRGAILQEYCDIKAKQVSYIEQAIRDARWIRDKVASLKQRLIQAFPDEKFDVTEIQLRRKPSSEDLHRLEKLAQNIAKNNQRIRIPTTVTLNGEKFMVEEENRIAYQAEGLIIKAADEFRLYLQPPDGPYRLSWKFEVNSRGGAAVDIGFSVMEQAANGTLPQVVSYSRCKKSLEPCSVVIEPKNVSENDALVVLFDNTFSWLKEKSVSYVVTIEPLAPFSLFSEQDQDGPTVSLADSLREVDVDDDKKLYESRVVAAVSLEPDAIKEDAYQLLQEAFTFHRDHAWVIQSLIEREAAPALLQSSALSESS